MNSLSFSPILFLSLTTAALLVLPSALADDVPFTLGADDVFIDQAPENTPTCTDPACTQGSTVGPISTPSTPPFCTPIVCNTGEPIQILPVQSIPAPCDVVNQYAGPNCGSQPLPGYRIDVEWTDISVDVSHVAEFQSVGPFTILPGLTICNTAGSCVVPVFPGLSASGTITVTVNVGGSPVGYSIPFSVSQ